MSIPSLLTPAVWASQIAARNPLAAAAAQGATSFGSTLQALLQKLHAGSGHASGGAQLLKTKA